MRMLIGIAAFAQKVNYTSKTPNNYARLHYAIKLIINKEAIQQKYRGGMIQLKADFGYRDGENGQEDNMLINLRSVNTDEHYIEKLMQSGGVICAY